MRDVIHPRLVATTVTCGACGTSFDIRSTVGALRLDICSSCHPAYTGQTERRAGGSMVERFDRRWGRRPALTTS